MDQLFRTEKKRAPGQEIRKAASTLKGRNRGSHSLVQRKFSNDYNSNDPDVREELLDSSRADFIGSREIHNFKDNDSVNSGPSRRRKKPQKVRPETDSVTGSMERSRSQLMSKQNTALVPIDPSPLRHFVPIGYKIESQADKDAE